MGFNDTQDKWNDTPLLVVLCNVCVFEGAFYFSALKDTSEY